MDVIAGHGWTDAEIPDLLLRLSAAMTGEVEALAGLSPLSAPRLAYSRAVGCG
jgi:hypothetical protein